MNVLMIYWCLKDTRRDVHIQMICTHSTGRDPVLPSLKLSAKKTHCTQLLTLTIPRSFSYSLYLFSIPIPYIPADRSLADYPPYEDHWPSQICPQFHPEKHFIHKELNSDRQHTQKGNQEKLCTFICAIGKCRYVSTTEKEIRFNEKITGVMLRRLHTEAMNESPLSRGLCIYVCATTRRLFGLQLLPNWLTVLCLWTDPLRYDYHLPRPCSLASWSETTHTVHQTETFQVSLNIFQCVAS